MAQGQGAEVEGGLYGRLLQRLALALDAADTAVRLRAEAPDELELRGLSPAELELIRAYLERDMRWLRGWHAAAEELARLERQPGVLPVAASKPLERPRGLLKRRQQLCCALCGTPIHWSRGQTLQACSACGSQLFRAGSPR